MGTFPPSGPKGLCCCRATGMNYVLQVLGIGPYTLVFCNEKPEGSFGGTIWGTSTHRCVGTCSNPAHGRVYRQYWSGATNNWEAAIRSGGVGSICYAPGTGSLASTGLVGTYVEIASYYKPYYWYYGDTELERCSSSCTITGYSGTGCNTHSSWWTLGE
jgi:hypothetical protein